MFVSLRRMAGRTFPSVDKTTTMNIHHAIALKCCEPVSNPSFSRRQIHDLQYTFSDSTEQSKVEYIITVAHAVTYLSSKEESWQRTGEKMRCTCQSSQDDEKQRKVKVIFLFNLRILYRKHIKHT